MDAHPASGGETPKMNGSVLIYVADTEEQVWQLVKNDIYTKTGVWDSDKVSSLYVPPPPSPPPPPPPPPLELQASFQEPGEAGFLLAP